MPKRCKWRKYVHKTLKWNSERDGATECRARSYIHILYSLQNVRPPRPKFHFAVARVIRERCARARNRRGWSGVSPPSGKGGRARRVGDRSLGVWAALVPAVYLLSAVRNRGAQFIIGKWSRARHHRPPSAEGATNLSLSLFPRTRRAPTHAALRSRAAADDITPRPRHNTATGCSILCFLVAACSFQRSSPTDMG